MGAYSTFSVGQYTLFEKKYIFINELMSVFLNTDFRRDVEADGEDTITYYRYQMPVSRYKKRLDLMGYTLKRAYTEFDYFFDFDDYFNDYDEEEQLPPKEAVDLEFFIKRLLECLDSNDDQENNTLVEYMFNNDWPNNYVYGFPLSDIRSIIRVFLEYVREEEIVEYELSNLIDSGFYDEDFDFVENAKLGLEMLGKTHDKIIIVTEGTSDIAILKKAFEHRFPEEMEFFSFFDYKLQKLPGGTPEVLKLAKTFATVGIKNRIILIFDNDTIGKEEYNRFKQLKLPDNIKGICYPDLEMAVCYPTYKENDSELQFEDINGKAVSIELFLGDTILKNGNDYIPIQWKKNNQGVISDKENVKREFYRRCKDNPDTIDWTGLDKILNIIFESII